MALLPTPTTLLSRRRLLALTGAVAAGTGVAACGLRSGSDGVAGTGVGRDAVRAAEAARPSSGTVRALSLRARPVEVDLGGRVVPTWAYGDTVPGAPLRCTAGDRVRVNFANDLPVATSVHWHGLAIRNDMDGVPGVTTPETPAGGTFDFDFVVPDPGTHWLHPHHGLQLDRGLYAPFVVDDPAEPGAYDAEWLVVLDDWTDGVGPSPEQILADLRAGSGGGMGMGGMGMDGMGGMAGSGSEGMHGGGMHGGAGDVDYPLYLVNGRVPADPDVLSARPGDRVRLRVVNASADTVFVVALDRHRLTVTHSDGYPVAPQAADAVVVGMGERYDAVVTLSDGAFVLAAEPVGKFGSARALVRTGSGAVPPESYRPAELDGDVLSADRLRAADGAALEPREPDSVQDVVLSGGMRDYVWTINGRTYAETVPLTVESGQAARLRIRNMSMMPHPLHVHGHTFQLGPAGGRGPRKDTVLVPAMGGIDVDLVADNPGRWMVHCHNGYHVEVGMMTRLDYVA
ncbi:MAG: multicopper oxidase family protein [Candidatus Nanopelagicales bacterium]